MKKYISLKNIIIVILVIVLVIQYFGITPNQKSKIIKVDGKKYEVIKYAIDTVDVIKTKIVTRKGDDIYYETIKEVQIPTVIDTQALLQNYYAKNVYKDVLTLPDSLGTVSVIDTITQNKILGRTFNASVKQRTIKETTIVKELPKTQLYWGLNSNFNKTDLVSAIGTGLVLKTKSDKLYQIGGGVLNTTTNGSDGKFSPYVGVGVYWKIRLLK
jgi:hypothetical protein